MLLTVYKNEQDVIDKVILVAEDEDDAKELLDFHEEYKRRAEGSGTGRYGSHDNWTFSSDGTKYPENSYGTGKEPEPFVPLPADAPEGEIQTVHDAGQAV
jgi:hypothetical protein